MGTIWKRRNKEEERKNGKNERKDLTLTGLLMEGFGCLTRNKSARRTYSRLRVFGRKVLYDPQGGTIF
jgi:hypothetical protein